MIDQAIRAAYNRTGSPQLYEEDFSGDGGGEFVGGRLKNRIGPLVKQIKQNGAPKNQMHAPQPSGNILQPNGNGLTSSGGRYPMPQQNGLAPMNPGQVPMPGGYPGFGPGMPQQPIDPNGLPSAQMMNGMGFNFQPPRPDIWSYITGMGFR